MKIIARNEREKTIQVSGGTVQFINFLIDLNETGISLKPLASYAENDKDLAAINYKLVFETKKDFLAAHGLLLAKKD